MKAIYLWHFLCGGISGTQNDQRSRGPKCKFDIVELGKMAKISQIVA